MKNIISSVLAVTVADFVCGISAGALPINGDTDISGKVDIEDAVKVIGHINGLKCLTAAEANAADTGLNRSVDIIDAVNIISYLNGNPSALDKKTGNSCFDFVYSTNRQIGSLTDDSLEMSYCEDGSAVPNSDIKFAFNCVPVTVSSYDEVEAVSKEIVKHYNFSSGIEEGKTALVGEEKGDLHGNEAYVYTYRDYNYKADKA